MNTVSKETYIEFEEKKSKFIGYIKPVQTKKEAESFIHEIRLKHADARHNVPVYRVVENGQEYFKFDDDGEPSGTAGKPMGEILNLLDVSNLVVVATRYFGGIKLGAGGLVRNYAKTAKLAVQEAGIIEYIEKESFLLDFPYSISGDVDRIIMNASHCEILGKNYGERITYRIAMSKELKDELKELKDVILINI